MDALRIEYEKTALHRMGIPVERAFERAFERVSWLRGMLESGSRRNQPKPAPRRVAAAGGRTPC